ncbi:lytic polysaccharide monooxygenase [Yokenella regensburgei]|jgi:chitin-binding protein|uniref:lytic polysaccharide monooxygenase n=1 Tax=Yokenella regensburgei TaxID=158877 RepID=UPI0014332BF6|nr:lytic polysaccharide monooxygenase [Yokenella regensburgei]QIU89469.1 chitin-binding protein [Yokenella regensburgei]
MNMNVLRLSLISAGVFTAMALSLPSAGAASTEKEKAPRHGTPSEPISRQQLCFDGQDYHWPVDGSNIKNAACKAAYQVNYNKYKDTVKYPEFKDEQKLIEQSNYPFVQKNEFAHLIPAPDYNDQEKVKAAIPDGTLCSGNNVGQAKDSKKPYLYNDKSGMDIPAPWTASKVHLNAKGEIEITYHASATHDPSFFEVYLSNADYKASERALKWSDLTLLAKVDKPQLVGSDYKFVAPAKEAKGPRVLFIRWQRIDPAGEGFYSCSDIDIQ